MVEINSRKAAIVGCGFVGAASAFALMESHLFTELVLIDADKNSLKEISKQIYSSCLTTVSNHQIQKAL